jgi:hypothetical protein
LDSGPRIYIPKEQGVAVTPLGTGSLSVFSYDWQEYGAGVLTSLHTIPYIVKVSYVEEHICLKT